MKRVLLFTSILMMAGAMSAWAAECAAGKYGAITIATVDGKCVATLDPDDTTSVNIPNDVTIDQFVYDRGFDGEYHSSGKSRGSSFMTLCLPFSGYVEGATLYEIMNIEKRQYETEVWVIEAIQSHVSQQNISAGVPYFISANKNVKVSFFGDYEGGQVILNTSTLSPTKFGANNEWEFRGTYNYKKWEEGDSQIGHVYGFAAKDTTTASGSFKAGQFVKVKAGAYIKPMRAYLYYNKQTLARRGALAKATDDEDLPSTIEVVFKDKNGVIASIHRMDPVTGAVTPVEGWYDMKGRKLNKKPTLPGTYFNNGEKVIIK